MTDSANKQLYAHSRDGQPVENWQPLDTHAANVAQLASEFAAPFQSSEWAAVAGWLHDLGKADPIFQGYLMRENGLDDAEYDSGRVNHSSAGAAFAEEHFGACIGRILAFLAAGHHAGLPDWYSVETGHAALSIRLEEGRANLARIRAYAGEVATKCGAAPHPPEFARKPEHLHLWMRMLFSCLTDADFLDTEAFMNPQQAPLRAGFKTLSELKPVFDAAMIEKAAGSAKTTVNAIRAEILGYCRQAACLPTGIFSLSVPTGGGKTLSGMAFALAHAIRHDKKRIIYVIPYTSIIEQTAGILADIFGRENVVEHHSNLDPEKETQHSRLASENWDAPIIVTTNVQFFESLYAARSGRCRKLHNLVNSVVIFDEAQLLPPNLLTPCVDVMNQLSDNYGVTLLLSTATQPALPGLRATREIIPASANLCSRLKRTAINFPPDLSQQASVTDWSALATQLCEHSQVLCIVNTRRDCYDLHACMPEDTIHLSALMCGEHRSQVIGTIKARLAAKQPIRVVSTQLVEAGVDIDFPVVYRALAGLDSIAQAAGRCNREGNLGALGQLGQVHVFVPPKPAPRGLLHKAEITTRELCATPDFSLEQEDAFIRYFGLFYSKLNDTGGQFQSLLVKDVNPSLHIQFRTAAEKFRLIDDQEQQPVIVRYGESPDLIGRLRFAGPTREIMRRLQRYTVNLPRRMADIMLADGRLVEVEPKKAPGLVVQCSLHLYDDEVGLDVYREHLPIEDLYQ